jgi:hypothetical protein
MFCDVDIAISDTTINTTCGYFYQVISCNNNLVFYSINKDNGTTPIFIVRRIELLYKLHVKMHGSIKLGFGCVRSVPICKHARSYTSICTVHVQERSVWKLAVIQLPCKEKGSGLALARDEQPSFACLVSRNDQGGATQSPKCGGSLVHMDCFIYQASNGGIGPHKQLTYAASRYQSIRRRYRVNK